MGTQWYSPRRGERSCPRRPSPPASSATSAAEARMPLPAQAENSRGTRRRHRLSTSASHLASAGIRDIVRAIKRAEVEATPKTRNSPEKLLKLSLLELITVPSFSQNWSNHSVAIAMFCKEQLDVWNFIYHSSNTTTLASLGKCVSKTIYGMLLRKKQFDVWDFKNECSNATIFASFGKSTMEVIGGIKGSYF
ncbi:hypothetical protein ACP70R_006876 [Stipagrostis hirtigluma subsp. patula]